MRVQGVLIGAALLALISVPAPLAAQGLDLDVSVRAGTLGLGVEAGKLITDRLAVRGGVNFGRYDLDQEFSDTDYQATFEFEGISALVDFYPARRGSFHLTGGYLTSPLKVSAVGTPSSSGTFDINGTEYSSAEVGDLTASLGFASGPYVGLGFGSPARGRRALRFKFDIGAVIGKSEFNMDATGAGGNPALQADVAAKRAEFQKDVDKFVQVYPVISFGLGIGF